MEDETGSVVWNPRTHQLRIHIDDQEVIDVENVLMVAAELDARSLRIIGEVRRDDATGVESFKVRRR
jgi:hypothetical protein